ncbi:MAG: hypothetical protein WC683_10080 [bacterium]
MSSNLPPGVTDGMLPGNRPEDGAREALEEWALLELCSLKSDEFKRAILIGKAAIEAERDEIDLLVDNAIHDERESLEMEGWQPAAADAAGGGRD